MSRNASYDFKETLNAKSKDLEDGSRVINQYRMSETIGMGAYSTVHKATLKDDPSVSFAIKEFGKTRLRKNHRASTLRRPALRGARGGGPRPRGGFVANHSSYTQEEGQEKDKDLEDPLMLIRHEIAILKKLHHPHVVQLFEVLDDPSKDSLYMVFEHCPDGRIMDVKLNEKARPIDEDKARSFFIQILLGIEYLHHNDIVHRDIKPDNILLCDGGRTCKIVDFGVSEMFVKPGDDTMQKSAGSPAFMSPELCTAGHSAYHGRSDDIWSFGVTLYCMVVGHLPFNKDNFFEMYEAIKTEEPEYPDHLSPELVDLLKRMLTKDPEKRATIQEMRQHPWVLEHGGDSLISAEDNLEKVVMEVTEEELDCAICKITNIFTFARAISKFKKGGSMNRARREASESGTTSDAGKPESGTTPLSDTDTVAINQEGATSIPTVTYFDSPKEQTKELPPMEQARAEIRREESSKSVGSKPENPDIPISQSPEGEDESNHSTLQHVGDLAKHLAEVAVGRKDEEYHHKDQGEEAKNRATPPKVLDEPTVSSPKSENVPTPPGASAAYLAAKHDEDVEPLAEAAQK